MLPITAYQGVCLARMVLRVGDGRDCRAKPVSWAWLPPDEREMVHFRIPVALIEQMLARKRGQLENAPAVENAAAAPRATAPKIRFDLPLARVVMPLTLPRGSK